MDSTTVDRTGTVDHSSEDENEERAAQAAAAPRTAAPSDRDPAADRRLGVRVISFLITLCVFVTGYGAFRTARSAGTPVAVRSARLFKLPALPPPRLVQVIPGSFTLPGTAPSIPWPGTGQSAVEIEGVRSLGTSGDVGTPVPIASVTKTMTAYLVLAAHPLAAGDSGPDITVSDAEAAAYSGELSQGQSLVKVYAGERISERQALEALMLASADNVARILARWDAGSISAFVASMNSAARRLGMTHTTYTDPSGLDPSTVSTATDQIKLAEAALRSASFRSIVGTQIAEIPDEGVIANFNRLLGQDGVIGIKTGSTDSAEGCLLFAADFTVGGQSETVIGAVFGQPLGSGNNFLGETLFVAAKMIEAAERSIATATIAAPGALIASIRRSDAAGTRLGVASAVTVVGRPGQTYDVLVSGDPSAATLEVTSTGTASSTAASTAASAPLIPFGVRGALAAD